MSAQSETSCPDTVLASIAWYPDQLDEARRGLVESHAAECSACRDELAFLAGESEPDLPLPDADAAYAKVLARIERSEVGARSAPTVPSQRAPMRTRGAFGARPAALAAGLALALLVGGLGGLYIGNDAQPVFQTVGEGVPDGTATAGVVAPAGPSLDVVFRADSRAENIHAALRAIGGQVVSGPTQIGVFRVMLVPTADVTAAARVLRGEGQGVATFAEPVAD